MRLTRHVTLAPPRARGLVVLLLVMFAAVITAALAHVSLRLGVLRLGYSISELTRERRALEEENRRLRLELSLLRGPERVERLAREKLGMERPDPGRIRVVRVSEPAAPSPGAPAAAPPPGALAPVGAPVAAPAPAAASSPGAPAPAAAPAAAPSPGAPAPGAVPAPAAALAPVASPQDPGGRP